MLRPVASFASGKVGNLIRPVGAVGQRLSSLGLFPGALKESVPLAPLSGLNKVVALTSRGGTPTWAKLKSTTSSMFSTISSKINKAVRGVTGNLNSFAGAPAASQSAGVKQTPIAALREEVVRPPQPQTKPAFDWAGNLKSSLLGTGVFVAATAVMNKTMSLSEKSNSQVEPAPKVTENLADATGQQFYPVSVSGISNGSPDPRILRDQQVVDGMRDPLLKQVVGAWIASGGTIIFRGDLSPPSVEVK